MAGSLTIAIDSKLVDHILGTTTYAPTKPIKVRLTSTVPTASTAGTEISGGGYTAGGATIVFNAASGGTATNQAVTWTNMPGVTVAGIDLFDSSATPVRIGGGPLDTPKTMTAGQNFALPTGSISVALG